jgi:hypothetical protein
MWKTPACWSNEEKMLSLQRRLVQEHRRGLTLKKPQAIGIAFASLYATAEILLLKRRMKAQPWVNNISCALFSRFLEHNERRI